MSAKRKPRVVAGPRLPVVGDVVQLNPPINTGLATCVYVIAPGQVLRPNLADFYDLHVVNRPAKVARYVCRREPWEETARYVVLPVPCFARGEAKVL